MFGEAGTAPLEAHRAAERAESERLRALRAAGVQDEAAYRPTDWDASHGPWLVPVAELLKVEPPDLVAMRAQWGSAVAATTRVEPAAEEAAAALAAER